MRKLPVLVLLLLTACMAPRGYYFADKDVTKQEFQNEEDLFRALELAEKQQTVVDYGKKYLGTRYRYGGTTPKKGFDCSGFTRYVYENSMDIDLPRTARDMSRIGVETTPNALSPGDLLFFDLDSRLDHVAIYIGNGRFFHASQQYRKLIEGDLHNEYFSTRFNTARRVLND